MGKAHPNVATALNNLAELYRATNRLAAAEPLYQRALEIDESSLGKDHPNVARDLNNLAQLYQATNRYPEADPLMKRAIEILVDFTRQTGHPYPHLMTVINNYAGLLKEMGKTDDQIHTQLKPLAPELFNQ